MPEESTPSAWLAGAHAGLSIDPLPLRANGAQPGAPCDVRGKFMTKWSVSGLRGRH